VTKADDNKKRKEQAAEKRKAALDARKDKAQEGLRPMPKLKVSTTPINERAMGSGPVFEECHDAVIELPNGTQLVIRPGVNGGLEVRANEGRLMVIPHVSNEIEVLAPQAFGWSED
jgi:hypothetical protein